MRRITVALLLGVFVVTSSCGIKYLTKPWVLPEDALAYRLQSGGDGPEFLLCLLYPNGEFRCHTARRAFVKRRVAPDIQEQFIKHAKALTREGGRAPCCDYPTIEVALESEYASSILGVQDAPAHKQLYSLVMQTCGNPCLEVVRTWEERLPAEVNPPSDSSTTN